MTQHMWDPATPLLGIYVSDLKIYTHKKICTQMFIENLFIMELKLETAMVSFYR